MSKVWCKECVFWDQRETATKNYGADKQYAGLCRMNSPMVKTGSMVDPWITTYEEDWCGDGQKEIRAEPINT